MRHPWQLHSPKLLTSGVNEGERQNLLTQPASGEDSLFGLVLRGAEPSPSPLSSPGKGTGSTRR